MNELDIRLECLRLATSQVNSAACMIGYERREGMEIELAAKFYSFVKGTPDAPKLKAA